MEELCNGYDCECQHVYYPYDSVNCFHRVIVFIGVVGKYKKKVQV